MSSPTARADPLTAKIDALLVLVYEHKRGEPVSDDVGSASPTRSTHQSARRRRRFWFLIICAALAGTLAWSRNRQPEVCCADPRRERRAVTIRRGCAYCAGPLPAILPEHARTPTHVRELQPPAPAQRNRRDDLHHRVHVLPRLRRYGPVERVPELCWRLRAAAHPARARVGRGRARPTSTLDESRPQAGRP